MGQPTPESALSLQPFRHVAIFAMGKRRVGSPAGSWIHQTPSAGFGWVLS